MPEEIDRYMNALGFHRMEDWTYTNKDIILSDVKPQNVLKDKDGNLYVIDVEIRKSNARE